VLELIRRSGALGWEFGGLLGAWWYSRFWLAEASRSSSLLSYGENGGRLYVGCDGEAETGCSWYWCLRSLLPAALRRVSWYSIVPDILRYMNENGSDFSLVSILAVVE
jgi:hypothetical protein